MPRTRDLVLRCLTRFGLKVSRAANQLDAKRLDLLERCGTTVILDVGANMGQWSGEVRRQGHRGRIVSFEPVPEAFAVLNAKSDSLRPHHCHPIALGGIDGEARLQVSHDTVCSSLLDPSVHLTELYPSAAVRQSIPVPVRRLDTLACTVIKPSDRAYLKIDTQGFELEVLSGATGCMDQIVAVEVEMSLQELYAGQALLPEVWCFLTGHGFQPFWIERGYADSQTKAMLQVDALFVRPACLAAIAA